MSSGTVMWLVRDRDIHVAYDVVCRMWWAVGKGGSYGGDETRERAVATAVDAATNYRCRVVVHRRTNEVDFIITRMRVRPAPQFFQDSVP